ncbi:MAG: DUF4962 domain-containing protein, partial [Candidatus Latescibacterota bacterium]|nr:DUF4962 domain-containing protein [Candidatus Latescibacterota bacterium]
MMIVFESSLFPLVVFALFAVGSVHASVDVDERDAEPGEWGFRPKTKEASAVNPPNFSWRPQNNARHYELEVSRKDSFVDVVYRAEQIVFNVHTPTEILPGGDYYWRFRYTDSDEELSGWSRTRQFSLSDDTTEMPLPDRETLINRIPDTHPRLFIRPEDVASLRRRKERDLKTHYDSLVRECEALLAERLSTEEPPLYADNMVRGSDPWREVWWGNRRITQKVLDGAATLAFTWMLNGNEAYAEEAKRILLACAEWDPHGSTGYRYNDEAGMPFNYYFCRTYTYLFAFLSEVERDICRQLMKIRGDEMNGHLNPRHLWKPFGSHANRAWHFLGEIGVTFLGEVDGAEDWVWFAMNVFANTYPVWNDDDGGWHEGTQYWNSYQQRFTWWADIMRAAIGINAFDKPYYSKVGYYPMYLLPPGTQGGGFGDLTARRESEDNVDLVRIFAAQSGNPYWQWYVDVHGKEDKPNGYVDYIRGALPKVVPKSPEDLPTSRLFRGVGQAYLNTNILDALDNVEIVFKSSQLGTQSHGYESNNSFLLYAFGERLLIRTGRRDSYGSEHHKEWMWHTKSVNNITVNGEGQGRRTASSVGEVTRFHASQSIDFVEGEAGQAYEGRLDRFTRRILFLKPDVIVVYDVVSAPEPSSFEWRLHAPTEMILGDASANVVNGAAACMVDFLWPENLNLSQTDKFDTPPRPRIKLVEYHLTNTP